MYITKCVKWHMIIKQQQYFVLASFCFNYLLLMPFLKICWIVFAWYDVIINRAKNQTSTVQPDQSTAHNQKKTKKHNGRDWKEQNPMSSTVSPVPVLIYEDSPVPVSCSCCVVIVVLWWGGQSDVWRLRDVLTDVAVPTTEMPRPGDHYHRSSGA